MTRVSWATTGADDVEAVVGVLSCLENPEASRVKASRGDGGIDVLMPEAESPRRIEVYQVKSFTGRMTAFRRGQVELSLQRLVSYCAQHDLEITAWYLTVPMTWTNEARGWFLAIAAAQPFPCHWRVTSCSVGATCQAAQMSEPAGHLIAVAMPAEQWSVIDGSIDNTIAIDVVEAKDDVVATGIAIREAGWAQVPWVDGQWPPMDQVITLILTRVQWEFALTQLHRWQDLYGAWGDEDRPEVGDRAIKALLAHLS